jgi:precorrin-2 dehydrogenase
VRGVRTDTSSGLRGRRVLILEARLPAILGDLVRRGGGDVISVPAVVESAADPEEVRGPLERLCRGATDLIVFQTGTGVEHLYRQAQALGRGEAFVAELRRRPIAVRGPKPAAVLGRWQVRAAVTASAPHTTQELCTALAARELGGANVFVQHYGQLNDTLGAFLRGRGAVPVDALPYRWTPPADLGPLTQAILDLVGGRVDALLITSRPQVAHLFAVAESLGKTDALREALNTRVAVAAVGPVSRRALEERGVRVAVEPAQTKMAPVVAALAEHVARVPRQHAESYYPAFLDLRGRPCVVLGGGPAAEQKVRGLLDCGANVTLIAPTVTSGLVGLAAAHRITIRERAYARGDLAGAFLAIVADGDAAAHRAVWDEAEAEHVLLNAVDDAPFCHFIAPAIHRQGALTVAISTAGRSPALAVRLRDRIAAELGPGYAVLLDLLGGLREEIAAREPDPSRRAALWHRLVDVELLGPIRRGDVEEARRRAREVVDAAVRTP